MEFLCLGNNNVHVLEFQSVKILKHTYSWYVLGSNFITGKLRRKHMNQLVFYVKILALKFKRNFSRNYSIQPHDWGLPRGNVCHGRLDFRTWINWWPWVKLLSWSKKKKFFFSSPIFFPRWISDHFLIVISDSILCSFFVKIAQT